MIEQTGGIIKFVAFFVASKVGKSGLADVTVDVYDPTGAQVETDASATEIGGGLYSYSRPAADAGEWMAVFKTADATVDQQHLPSLWAVGRAGVDHLDEDVSVGQGLTQRSEPPTADAIANQVWDEAVGDHAGAGSTGKKLADVTAGLVQRSEPPTAAAVADQVWDELIVGHAVAGSTGELLSDIGSSIAPAVVQLTDAVTAEGNLTLIRGDSYTEDLSRAIEISSDTWPDLTGATIMLTIRRRREAFGTGSDGVLIAVEDVLASRVVGVATQTVVFELAPAETAALLPGESTGKFDIQATLADTTTVVTLVTGLVTVVEDQTR